MNLTLGLNQCLLLRIHVSFLLAHLLNYPGSAQIIHSWIREELCLLASVLSVPVISSVFSRNDWKVKSWCGEQLTRCSSPTSPTSSQRSTLPAPHTEEDNPRESNGQGSALPLNKPGGFGKNNLCGPQYLPLRRNESVGLDGLRPLRDIKCKVLKNWV